MIDIQKGSAVPAFDRVDFITKFKDFLGDEYENITDEEADIFEEILEVVDEHMMTNQDVSTDFWDKFDGEDLKDIAIWCTFWIALACVCIFS